MAKRKREFEIGDDGELSTSIEDIIGDPDVPRKAKPRSVLSRWLKGIAQYFLVVGLVIGGFLFVSSIVVDNRSVPGLETAIPIANQPIVSVPTSTLNCLVYPVTWSGVVVYRVNLTGNAELHLIGDQRTCDLTLNDDMDTQPDWSPDRGAIAFVSDQGGNMDIWRVQSNGENALNMTHDDAADMSPDWSPDGTQIVFATARNQYQDIHVMASNGGNRQRLTDFDAYNNSPVWSPDGNQIAFTSNDEGRIELLVIPADGSSIRRMAESRIIGRPAWSPDGAQIVYAALNDLSQSDLWVIQMDDEQVRQLTNTAENEQNPIWTTEGILYLTDRGIYRMDEHGQNIELMVGQGDIVEFDYLE